MSSLSLTLLLIIESVYNYIFIQYLTCCYHNSSHSSPPYSFFLFELLLYMIFYFLKELSRFIIPNPLYNLWWFEAPDLSFLSAKIALASYFFCPLRQPSVWVCKGRKPFRFSKTYFFFFWRPETDHFHLIFFFDCGLQKCEFYFDLTSDNFTLFNLFYIR